MQALLYQSAEVAARDESAFGTHRDVGNWNVCDYIQLPYCRAPLTIPAPMFQRARRG